MEEFIENFVEEHLGAPHSCYVSPNLDFVISVPRKETRLGYGKEINLEFEGWRESWEEVAEDIIERLRIADLGDYSLRYVNPAFIELEKA